MGWVVTPQPRFTPPRKRPPVPIRWEARWTSELVWTQRLEEKSFGSAGDRTPVVHFVLAVDGMSEQFIANLRQTHTVIVVPVAMGQPEMEKCAKQVIWVAE
jgi:hypothetical protein